MKSVLVVVDLQYGSTGKGQIAGTLGLAWGPDTVVTAWAPNAGHTFIHGDKKYVHTMLPTCSVLPSVKAILLGPGTVLNVDILCKEILEAGPEALAFKRLIIHPNASILLPEHLEEEKAFVKIGSTMKGSAAAAMQKMRRDPAMPNIARKMPPIMHDKLIAACKVVNLDLHISHVIYEGSIDHSNRMVVEGAQGHSLSIHSKFYPYCTSRDVSVNQILADCAIPRRCQNLKVVGVCRTYPIRVANRFVNGVQVGTSGGCYEDQIELDWKQDLYKEPELTTVTKLPRRVFTFSTDQIMEAARINCPDMIALTFADYADHVANNKYNKSNDHALHHPPSEAVMSYIRRIEAATGVDVRFLSYGPTSLDVYDIGNSTLLRPNASFMS